MNPRIFIFLQHIFIDYYMALTLYCILAIWLLYFNKITRKCAENTRMQGHCASSHSCGSKWICILFRQLRHFFSSDFLLPSGLVRRWTRQCLDKGPFLNVLHITHVCTNSHMQSYSIVDWRAQPFIKCAILFVISPYVYACECVCAHCAFNQITL